MSRNTPAGSCQDSDGNARNLTLNATACTLCSDHVDCHSCVQVGTRYLQGALPVLIVWLGFVADLARRPVISPWALLLP